MKTTETPLKVALVSLGCARTLVDSEVALGGLARDGYQIVADVRKADVAIVNTCGFIEEAKTESIETVLGLCELKKKGRLASVVMLGCLAQRYGQELSEELKEVDAIVGTNDFASLSKVLEPLRSKKRVLSVSPRPTFILDEKTPRVRLTPKHLAYVKISEGCINACSYCVIPQMKGAHRSRTVESIVSEIATLPDTVREVNLIGQDTAAFGWDRSRTFELPRLLDAVAALGKAPWNRLLYAHPGHVTDAMIESIARNPSICNYVDFPVEHTHDAMLSRMSRGVTRAQMETALVKLRRAVPGIQVRTTIIVGFPGETEEEFRDLMDTLRDWRFERLGAFMFSDEEGARAHKMPGHLSDEIKRERRDAVLELQSEISTDILKGFVGKKMRVLIEEKDATPGVYIGRSEGDAYEVDGQVFVRSFDKLPLGEFVDAEITESLEYDLVGRAV